MATLISQNFHIKNYKNFSLIGGEIYGKINCKKLPTYFIRRLRKISDIRHHFTRISSENLYLPGNNYARTNKSMLGVKIWNSVQSDSKKKAVKIAYFNELLEKH